MSVNTAARVERASTVRRSPARRGALEWVDRFLGSDPGLIRLLAALQAVATTGVAMVAEWLFVRWTHALQIDTPARVVPPAQAAVIAGQHHGVVVVAVLLGAVMGLTAAFCAAMFATPRALVEGFALMPAPMVAGLALGLAVQPYRVLSLASLVLVLGVGAYGRRFGPRGFVGGVMLFVGDFFGFFLNGQVRLSGLGWLAGEIVIGVLVAILAQFTVFYPRRRAALGRMRRSFAVRAREVAHAAVDLMDSPANLARGSRRLHRRLAGLNETALMIDAQLGQPGALPRGWSATTLHRRLFDAELALTNMCRFAERLAHVQLPPEQGELVRQALLGVTESGLRQAELAGLELLARLRQHRTDRHDDRDLSGLQLGEPEVDRDTQVVAHRFATSVLGFTEAVNGWREATSSGSPADTKDSAEPFAPAVPLVAGWLPGSAMVSAAASLETGPAAHGRLRAWDPRRWDRIGLAPYSRVAIQMTIAVTAAILLGDVLSGRRFYWAVLAAFVTFLGANNVGEQLRKALFRVTGTVIGILLGAVGAHLVGDRTGVAIAVILVALFFGLYLLRISYAFMVIAITIAVSQLYAQLDEFTDALLVLRLEETALGAAVAALTVLYVLPLHTRRATRVATRQYIQALTAVVEQAIRRLVDQAGGGDVRAAMRRLDGSYQALATTMLPSRIRFTASADGRRERLLQSAAAARHYARNLHTDTDTRLVLNEQTRADLRQAKQGLTASLDEVVAHLQDTVSTPRTYVRAAAVFDQAATRLDNGDYLAPTQLALRDLQLLDGAMATIALTLGLTVRAIDTADADVR